MNREDFEKLVAEGYEQLPEWAKNKVKNVALLVEDEPTEEVRAFHRLTEHETLLGHYHGIPITARVEEYGGLVMPDTITIYQEPILNAAEEECPPEASDDVYLEHVRRIVSETVWHEYAHYLGMDEEEVRHREHKRDGKI
jgi:predicted Zn-dependent protease with MMP-like domain